MGSKVVSPFPTYEVALANLNEMEITHLRGEFRKMSSGSGGGGNRGRQQQQQHHHGEVATVASLAEHIRNVYNSNNSCSSSGGSSLNMLLHKRVLPRLFAAMDTKKDGVLDVEEYISAVALFRVGSTEEKIKVLFAMYEPIKEGLPREQFRCMLVDATLVTIKNNNVQEDWLEDQRELSGAMVDMALQQFASSTTHMDVHEFINFVKVEGAVQALLFFLPSLID